MYIKKLHIILYIMSSERVLGRVKWFNNKNGYGFISVVDGPVSEAVSDIFAHYSCIRGYTPVKGEDFHYKYLVEGEYVEFDLSKLEDDKHEFKANDISGVRGGMLMCETHEASTKSRKTRSKSSMSKTLTKPLDEEVAASAE